MKKWLVVIGLIGVFGYAYVGDGRIREGEVAGWNWQWPVVFDGDICGPEVAGAMTLHYIRVHDLIKESASKKSINASAEELERFAAVTQRLDTNQAFREKFTRIST